MNIYPQTADLRLEYKRFLKERKDLRGDEEKWLLLLDSKQIQDRICEIATYLDKKFEGTDIVVVGILKGAAWFMVDITRQLTIPYSTYFLKASSYENEQTQSSEVKIESKIEKSKFEGRTVILLDELFDNGKTLHSVKKSLEDLGIIDIYTCTFFVKDRPIESPCLFPLPNLYGYLIPNIWVNGYGLDDKQEKRGWPILCACPKSDIAPKTIDDEIFDSEEKYQAVIDRVHASRPF